MKVKMDEIDDYTIYVNFSGKIMKTSFLALHEYAVMHDMTDDQVVRLAIFEGVSKLEAEVINYKKELRGVNNG